MYTCIHVYMYTYIHIYIYTYGGQQDSGEAGC